MKKIEHKVYVRHEEVDSEGSWAISYGDMITLLLAFFVLYFSTDPKASKQKLLNSSLVMALSPKSETEKITSTKVQLNMGKEEGFDVSKAVVQQFGGQVKEIGQRIVIEFPEVSFFSSGSIEISEMGQQRLVEFSQMYVPFSGNYMLGVKAFTDMRPVRLDIKRPYKDNLELSALRSIAAMRIMQKSGIPLKQMKVSGYGEYEKVVKNVTKEQNMALARKVILIIEPETEI